MPTKTEEEEEKVKSKSQQHIIKTESDREDVEDGQINVDTSVRLMYFKQWSNFTIK